MTAPRAHTPAPCVGVVCLRGDEVLLIKRGREPRAGEWSIPGGRVEWGETLERAALRELYEETGVRAELIGLIDVFDAVFKSADGRVERHYVLIDYAARWVSGEPRAGDDAAEAMFVPRADAERRVAWSKTAEVIRAAAAMETA